MVLAKEEREEAETIDVLTTDVVDRVTDQVLVVIAEVEIVVVIAVVEALVDLVAKVVTVQAVKVEVVLELQVLTAAVTQVVVQDFALRNNCQTSKNR